MTINFNESIKRGHIITNKTHWTDTAEIVSFYFFHILIASYLVIFSTYMLVREIISDNLGAFVLIFAVIQIVFGIYLIACLFNWRKLTRIEGIDFSTNRELLPQIVNGYYPGLTYEWDGNILLCSKPYDYWRMKWGLCVVLLFNEKDIYLNVLSYYRGPNPWMTFTNMDRAKEIGRIVLDQIKYNQTVHNTGI
jgi:hypothetical protein